MALPRPARIETTLNRPEPTLATLQHTHLSTFAGHDFCRTNLPLRGPNAYFARLTVCIDTCTLVYTMQSAKSICNIDNRPS